MPDFKKTRGKRWVKRKPRKFKRGKIFKSVRPYGVKPNPHPRCLRTRMLYADKVKLTANAVTSVCGNEQVYRINSIYNPNFTASDYTTRGWGIMSQMYRKYIVMGAKIEIVFSDPSADGTVCFASLNQTKTLQANSDENNMSSSLVYSSMLNNTGSQSKKFSFYVRPWSLLGLSKLEYKANKASRSANIDANPSTDLYLRIALSGSRTGGENCLAYVRIIYYVELFDREELTRSVIV